MLTDRQAAIQHLIKQANIGAGDKNLLLLIAGEVFAIANDLRFLAETAREQAERGQ